MVKSWRCSRNNVIFGDSIKKTGCSEIRPAGFFRRIAALLYDGLLLLAVLFAATAVGLLFNHGEAFASDNLYFHAYLVLISYFFYGWFWTHGGQTLGLKAWKLKILAEDRQPITWTQASIRFIGAILSWSVLGLGYIWVIFDRDNRAWHDRLSRTAVFFAPKP
ncbi:RDD family protein [Methylotuvimicrobium alcaliphilum]|uniref:RDD domain containing protein n=1 Tax=Methylotuvimicrobium alcaliphilum (strain DSM 19304 / NCIMB 14124 / VKM B-2133 / 20Z) TaxID=1091494 RepID=G4T0T7_META2|nr:RDD domain containing protein [Methylotuvimicrobium alcaliphilum 20Z]